MLCSLSLLSSDDLSSLPLSKARVKERWGFNRLGKVHVCTPRITQSQTALFGLVVGTSKGDRNRSAWGRKGWGKAGKHRADSRQRMLQVYIRLYHVIRQATLPLTRYEHAGFAASV